MFMSKLSPTPKNKKPKGKGACPSYLFARWREIREGGVMGYRDFGYEVMRVVPSLDPWRVDDEEWGRRLGRLRDLVEARDDSAVLGWFDVEVPRIMTLVPSRRRGQFLVGLYEVVESEGCEIFGD
jgi:hypothetical protein